METSSPSMDTKSLWQLSQHKWEVLPLFLIVLAGITGNLLVCIAICREKKLQNITNYFLMSLSVADLFVCCVVMPMSIINEFMGLWPLGIIMCDLWQVSDVMMCTSSIMHMCIISMDRYMAIRSPLKTRNKSRTSVGIKIATVWVISLATASPLIILCILHPEDILNEQHQCAIFNHHFLIYGSLTAFFIPLTIMAVAYTLTIQLLHKQAITSSKQGKEGIRRTFSTRKAKFFSKESVPVLQKLSDRYNDSSLNGYNKFAKKIKITTESDRKLAHPSETEPLAVPVQRRKASNISITTTLTALNSPRPSLAYTQRNNNSNIPDHNHLQDNKNQSSVVMDSQSEVSPTHDQNQSFMAINSQSEVSPAHDQNQSSVTMYSQSEAIQAHDQNQSLVTMYYQTEVTPSYSNRSSDENIEIIPPRKSSQSVSFPKSQDITNPSITAVTEHRNSCDDSSKLLGYIKIPSKGKSKSEADIFANNSTHNNMRKQSKKLSLFHIRSNDQVDNDEKCVMQLQVPQPHSLHSSTNNVIQKAIRKLSWTKLIKAGHNSDEIEQNVEGETVNNQEIERPANLKFRQLMQKHRAAFKVAGILMAKREEKNKVKTERKAIKVLGTMFVIFVICWAPFFLTNFSMGICQTCNIDIFIFKFFLWLGYVGSTLNPIIYTVFNKTFRNAFIKLLTCGKYKEDSPCSYQLSTKKGTLKHIKTDDIKTFTTSTKHYNNIPSDFQTVYNKLHETHL